MRRAHADVARCMAAFWQAPHLEEARRQVAVFDRETLVLPLVAAAHGVAQALPGPAVSAPSTATLAQAGSVGQQLTRVLRDALHAVLGKLQWGQVMLATDMASSSSAVACATTSPWRSQGSKPMGVPDQFRPSTSNMSNMPVFWACKKRTARRLPWA